MPAQLPLLNGCQNSGDSLGKRLDFILLPLSMLDLYNIFSPQLASLSPSVFQKVILHDEGGGDVRQKVILYKKRYLLLVQYPKDP